MGIYDIWEVLNPKPSIYINIYIYIFICIYIYIMYIYIYMHMYGLGSRVLTAAGLGTHQKGMSSCC